MFAMTLTGTQVVNSGGAFARLFHIFFLLLLRVVQPTALPGTACLLG